MNKLIAVATMAIKKVENYGRPYTRFTANELIIHEILNQGVNVEFLVTTYPDLALGLLYLPYQSVTIKLINGYDDSLDIEIREYTEEEDFKIVCNFLYKPVVPIEHITIDYNLSV